MFGLKLYDLLTLAGIVLGPLVAVTLTQFAEVRRRRHEGRLQLFRTLMTTRATPGDPAWTVAFNAVPIEYNKTKPVVSAWRDLLENLNFTPTNENIVQHDKVRQRKTTTLLFEMAKTLKIDIKESEIASEAYLSIGMTSRDGLWLDSLRAQRDIATVLQAQLNLIERQVPPAKLPQE